MNDKRRARNMHLHNGSCCGACQKYAGHPRSPGSCIPATTSSRWLSSIALAAQAGLHTLSLHGRAHCAPAVHASTSVQQLGTKYGICRFSSPCATEPVHSCYIESNLRVMPLGWLLRLHAESGKHVLKLAKEVEAQQA